MKNLPQQMVAACKLLISTDVFRIFHEVSKRRTFMRYSIFSIMILGVLFVGIAPALADENSPPVAPATTAYQNADTAQYGIVPVRWYRNYYGAPGRGYGYWYPRYYGYYPGFPYSYQTYVYPGPFYGYRFYANPGYYYSGRRWAAGAWY